MPPDSWYSVQKKRMQKDLTLSNSESSSLECISPSSENRHGPKDTHRNGAPLSCPYARKKVLGWTHKEAFILLIVQLSHGMSLPTLTFSLCIASGKKNGQWKLSLPMDNIICSSFLSACLSKHLTRTRAPRTVLSSSLLTWKWYPCWIEFCGYRSGALAVTAKWILFDGGMYIVIVAMTT